MAEGGDVQLTAAHQPEDDDCQYLYHHTDFDVAGRWPSQKFADVSSAKHSSHVFSLLVRIYGAL
jgi:hypothetical protein